MPLHIIMHKVKGVGLYYISAASMSGHCYSQYHRGMAGGWSEGLGLDCLTLLVKLAVFIFLHLFHKPKLARLLLLYY